MRNWYQKYRKRKKEEGYNKFVSLLELDGLLKRHVVDSLHGPIKTVLISDLKWYEFNRARIGVGVNQDATEISLWTHEFTEQIVGYLILDILKQSRVSRKEISAALDGIYICSITGGLYRPTAKHILTALHTISCVDTEKMNGDQYAEYFGFTGKSYPRRKRCYTYAILKRLSYLR